MYFLGMLTDSTVTFCRHRICLFKGFTDVSSCRYSSQMKILLVDADASIAMTFRISVMSDSSCARCYTRNICFVSVGFGGIV